jgi:hypothetical protein
MFILIPKSIHTKEGKKFFNFASHFSCKSLFHILVSNRLKIAHYSNSFYFLKKSLKFMAAYRHN